MSTIKVDTIKNTSNVEVFTAKAWVNFDGTQTAANMIRSSGNVSSITDNGTGEYRVNFTNAMTDTNYAVVTNGNRANDQRIGTRQAESTTTQCMVRGSNYTGATLQDSDTIFVAVFR